MPISSSFSNVRLNVGEMRNKGIELLEERYNFMVSFDSHYRLEVIDIEVAVAVKSLGEDTEMIHFTEIENDSMLIRIVAKSFDDVHIGLAEWMHDNDYVANGILRQVIHDGIEHIYDCPVKKAED